MDTRGGTNLNSIFSESTELVRVHTVKPARKERADKLKDIKFPVTPEQREKLRRLAKELPPGTKRNETVSNTKHLLQALEHFRMYPERCHEVIYEDTRQYMHVKPPRRVFDQIEEHALIWNTSIRKATHRLIMNYLDCGEVVIRFEQV